MKASYIGRKGFTLIEMLIVVAIIGLLAGAILVAIDPVRRINEARNARRWSEVNGMLNAILTKQVDDRAAFTGSSGYPIVADATNAQIIINVAADNGQGTCASASCTGATISSSGSTACWANLKDLTPNYIASIPIDPVGSPTFTATNTGYYIQKNTAGRIKIGACRPEAEGSTTPVISVMR